MAERALVECLASDLSLPPSGVEGVLDLLAAGAAVPFIARYRKERIAGLREEDVWAVARAVRRLLAFEQRKAAAIEELEARGALTDSARAEAAACSSLGELEAFQLRYRGTRRTRGAQARSRGLEPLALAILEQNLGAASLEECAAPYVAPDRGVPDPATAIEGASQIIAEGIAADPAVQARIRELFTASATVRSRLAEGREAKPGKYEMYYDFAEPAAQIPPHRILAIRRGEKEGWLRVSIEADRQRALELLREGRIKAPGTPAATVVETALADAYDRLLAPALEHEVKAELRRLADAEAIAVFARNVRSLLLKPPAGPVCTLGVNPGVRGGAALAVVDGEGKLLEQTTVLFGPPEQQAQPALADTGAPPRETQPLEDAKATLRNLIQKHKVAAIAIGNGAGGRQAEEVVRSLLEEMRARPATQNQSSNPNGCGIIRALVSDAGVALHAVSRPAREEFPDLAPTARAAVGLARRLQDPLAELAQADPRTIGVGQYQHDVNQAQLRESLREVVESCVNLVGVDLNRASAGLLAHVAGIGRETAAAIVRYRNENGPFRSRAQLRLVPGFTEKQFEQAAGFLRVYKGDEPLDATRIHPERYELVARIAADAGTDVRGLLGNQALIERIEFSRYAGGTVGEPTLADLRAALLYPHRDPRGPFRATEHHASVASLEDLKPGMLMDGTVTNVTNFGAFVDIGLPEDGLVHVSHLARRFVNDPNQVVGVGSTVRVKVLAVDLERRRIALSIRDAAAPPPEPPRARRTAPAGEGAQPRPRPRPAPERSRQPRERGRRPEHSQRRDARPGHPKPPPQEAKPKRDPSAPATAEDIARLIAHFQGRSTRGDPGTSILPPRPARGARS